MPPGSEGAAEGPTGCFQGLRKYRPPSHPGTTRVVRDYSSIDRKARAAQGSGSAAGSGDVYTGIDAPPGKSGLTRVRNADGEFEPALQVRPLRDMAVLERESTWCLPSLGYGRMSPVSFHANEKIAPMILRMIESARSEIKLMAYQLDHETGMQSLERAASERQVALRVLVDRRCFDEPGRGPVKQSERLLQLMRQAGEKLELRKLTPVHNGSGTYNSMHSKLWIFDDQIMVTGSPNFTGQSERNLENIVVIRDVNTVDDARVFFDAAWVKANRVPLEEVTSRAAGWVS